MATAALRLAALSATLACCPLALHAADTSSAGLLAADTAKGEWLMNGRTYDNRRFSPLDQITTANVKGLVPKWIYQTGKPATFQATPLVSDGVMYVSEPLSSVTALDAKTGRRIWHFDYKVTTKKLCCGPANRGVGLGYGKVYIATVDAHLVALDAKTGKKLWDITMATPEKGTDESNAMLKGVGNDATRQASGQSGIGANSAPLVYDGKVFAGVVGVGYGLHLESERPGTPLGTVVGIAGKYGSSGFLAAFDAETGARVWQWDTTQKGWEGDYVEKTAYGAPLPRDIAKEKAEDVKESDAWRYGGGSMWEHASARSRAGPSVLRHGQSVAAGNRHGSPRRQSLVGRARRARREDRQAEVGVPAGAARSLGLRRREPGLPLRRDGRRQERAGGRRSLENRLVLRQRSA